jgi:hypothetical protein
MKKRGEPLGAAIVHDYAGRYGDNERVAFIPDPLGCLSEFQARGAFGLRGSILGRLQPAFENPSALHS